MSGPFLWHNLISCHIFGVRQICFCSKRKIQAILLDGQQMINHKHKDHTAAKGRFMHGSIYHMLWDRPLTSARKKVIDLVPSGSSVIDIACGTGEFCFELAARQNCRVLGIDLSPRMISFAQKRNRFDAVRFESCDAADLARFETSYFDFAMILFLLHEVPRPIQIAAVKEASRVARKTVIVDSLAPLPRNIHGIALRIVEAIGGPGHYRSFADYLEAGGIGGVLKDSSVRVKISHRSIFWHGCREMVVLESRN
jgi:SAM-dependent methyltransferase